MLFRSFCGLAPGPLLALVLAQTLRHGPREGCKIALTPLVTDAPIIALSLALAATLAKAMAQSWPVAVAFLCGFYLLLVGSKVLVVLLAARSRDLLAGRPYRVVMRVLAVLLTFFALLLFREGWKHLG